MPTLKTVSASEIRPGDSYRLASDSKFVFPTYQLDAVRTDGDWRCWDNQGQLVHIAVPHDSVKFVVGFTNRKAKRQRGKIRRRARLKARDFAAAQHREVVVQGGTDLEVKRAVEKLLRFGA